MRQPLAGWQMVTPAPPAWQRRVQQLEEPEQGAPSWLQPPEGWTQRPGIGATALQSPEQQSAFW